MEPQPSAPGRSRTFNPPEARTVVLPGSSGAAALVGNSVPASGKIVANGVPRVSTLRPRLGWKVLTKSR